MAMDEENLSRIRELADEAGDDAIAQVGLLLDYAGDVEEREVPDPYYVGGYDRVYQLVDAGCSGLLASMFPRAHG
jgi:protein-tyrosine phosphatase